LGSEKLGPALRFRSPVGKQFRDLKQSGKPLKRIPRRVRVENLPDLTRRQSVFRLLRIWQREPVGELSAAIPTTGGQPLFRHRNALQVFQRNLNLIAGSVGGAQG
jgi:hypothetical protein